MLHLVLSSSCISVCPGLRVGCAVAPQSPETHKAVLTGVWTLLCLLTIWANPFSRDASPLLFAVWFIATVAFFLWSPGLVGRIVGRGATECVPPDDDLWGRAWSLAAKAGIKLRCVWVLESPWGVTHANAWALSHGRVVVTRKLLQEFTAAELDFILMHEIAHLRLRWVPDLKLSTFCGVVLVNAPLFLSYQIDGMPPSAARMVIVLGLALVGAAILGSMFWFNRRREHCADRIALGVTKNLSAAESALAKLAQFSPDPRVHETTLLATHPRMSKRVASLRMIAEELRMM